MVLLAECSAKGFILFSGSGIKTIVADHFELLFRDMPDQPFDEIKCRDGFFHVFIIFMTVVVKSDIFAIVTVDAGSGNYRASKIAADIFHNLLWIAFLGLCINVETIFVVPVNGGFHFFERRPKMFLEFVQKGCLEGIPQEFVVEMLDISPMTIVRESAFRDKTVDMRIPFKIPSEGMKDTDKTRDEISAFVHFEKHARENTVYRGEQTIEQASVCEEKLA